MADGLNVSLRWDVVGDDSDSRWHYNRCLYAYLAPRRPAIYYIGKCHGCTVRERLMAEDKQGVWACINQFCRTHRLIVAEISVPNGCRFTRELMADIESLLIFNVQPIANVQAKQSRTARLGLRVRCLGRAWPLQQRTFHDDIW